MALKVLEQSSLFLETISKNSTNKAVHYIVKQTPFVIRFGISGSTSLNFKSDPLTCCLLYDLPKPLAVEAVGASPLEYVCHPSSDGLTCSVDFRIKVLTTQHQNNLFLIKVSLGGSELSVLSHPIKSVSKPEQIRRKLSLAAQHNQPPAATPTSYNDETEHKVSASKKRARSEDLLATLDEMKKLQLQQSQMLELLLSSQMCNTAAATPLPTAVSQPPPTLGVLPTLPSATPATPSLCEALTMLVRAYEAEIVLDRPTKLRKLVSEFPQADRQLLNELGNVLCSKNISAISSGVPPPTVVRSAPPPPSTVLSPRPSLSLSTETNINNNNCLSPNTSNNSEETTINDEFGVPSTFFFDLGLGLGLDPTDLQTMTSSDVSHVSDEIMGWLHHTDI